MSTARSEAATLPEPDYEALRGLDWSFADAETQGATHGLHPYPAKFIPQIPRALIRHLHPGDDSRVLDPFCGSGTTLVEAALAGIPGVGVDLHPLACLISRVKTTPLPSGLQVPAEKVVRAAQSNVPEPVSIPRVDHWFSLEVQQALQGLVKGIGELANDVIADALRVALASIIVRVSNQESDTRYAAVQNDISASKVYEAFIRAARSAEAALDATWGGLFDPPGVVVLNNDVLKVRPEDIPGPVSLVVTSPPYPNAYEYWLYHKYRMYWLGMDPLHVREHEIGARPHYFKRDPQTANDFFVQMGSVFHLLARVLRAGGHICFQVGSSIIHGEVVDNASLVTAAAEERGFHRVLTLERTIPTTRKAFNPKHGRIREETILVFRKEGP